MTQQSATPHAQHKMEYGAQIGELRAILTLVKALSGQEQAPVHNHAGDSDSHYANAAPLVRQRFDALAQETASLAAAGLSALIAARDHGTADAAAAYLAHTMERAIRRMEKLLG